jgi:nicotinamide-nucleotide amidase
MSEPSVADLLDVLRERGETLAVAESLTAGLLAAALTDPPGASLVFRGGLVVYATDLKASLAGVPEPLLQAQGPVSAEVAAALAAGARVRLTATYGVGLTGVAGPDPQGNQPVGRVYVAVSTATAGSVRELDLPGDRGAVRAGAVRAAVLALADAVQADAVPADAVPADAARGNPGAADPVTP